MWQLLLRSRFENKPNVIPGINRGVVKKCRPKFLIKLSAKAGQQAALLHLQLRSVAYRPHYHLVFAISSSFSGMTTLTTFTKGSLISSSLMCGVRHFISFLNLRLHWKITLRYLSCECHILEPYQFLHLEHLIFDENMLALLYLMSVFLRRSISSCTSSHVSV